MSWTDGQQGYPKVICHYNELYVSHVHFQLTVYQQLEVISLLYAASQDPRLQSFDRKRGLNPTPGILNKLPETSINGVTFLRDSSHPQGGVLVATRKAAREIKDLPPGTVIIGGPPPLETMVGTNSLEFPNVPGSNRPTWDQPQALQHSGIVPSLALNRTEDVHGGLAPQSMNERSDSQSVGGLFGSLQGQVGVVAAAEGDKTATIGMSTPDWEAVRPLP